MSVCPHIVVSGSLAQVVGYVLEAPAPPFPVFVLGYAFNGFGVALQVRRHQRSPRQRVGIALVRLTDS